MSDKFSLADLNSTLNLVERLTTFKNAAFESSENFSRIDQKSLKFWFDHAKPIKNALYSIQNLNYMDRHIQQSEIIRLILDALQLPGQILSGEWIMGPFSKICELLEGFCCDVAAILKEKGKTVFRCDDTMTQEAYGQLRLICLAYRHLSTSQKGSEFEENLNPTFVLMKQILHDLSDVALRRCTEFTDESGFVHGDALQMLSKDITSAQMIGLLVPKIDSFSVSRFKYG